MEERVKVSDNKFDAKTIQILDSEGNVIWVKSISTVLSTGESLKLSFDLKFVD